MLIELNLISASVNIGLISFEFSFSFSIRVEYILQCNLKYKRLLIGLLQRGNFFK